MRNKKIEVYPVPVVNNLLFANSFKIKVQSKFKEILISFLFLLFITSIITLVSIFSGETASAGTIRFTDIKDLPSYKVVYEDGSIRRVTNSVYSREYENLQVGDIVAQFPTSTQQDKLQWIDNLIRERELLIEIEHDMEVAKVISILGNEERAKLVVKYAEEYNIPLYLVVGVIFAESSNNPNAISKVGARGLMQLMPDTAVLIARKLGMSTTALKIRKDPGYLNENEDINIMFGTIHLRDLYKKTGDWESAVHAYNQGYTRFIKGHRSNNYVKNVYKYWNLYETKTYTG